MKKVAFLIQHLIISSTMLLKNGGEFYTKDRWVVEQNTILFVFHNNNTVPCVLYVCNPKRNMPINSLLYGSKGQEKMKLDELVTLLPLSAAPAKHLIDLSYNVLPSPL